MIDDEDLQQRVSQKLADATSQIIVQARAKEYEAGCRLLRTYGATYGIGMLVLGTGAAVLALILQDWFWLAAPIMLGVALLSWIIGAIFVQMPDWLRKRLARRLLNRESIR